MKKILFIGLLLVTLIGSYAYVKVFKSNVNLMTKKHLYFPSNLPLAALKDSLKPYLKDMTSFELLAKKKKMTKPRGGHYIIKPGMSNNDLVNMFRAGSQTPIKVVFNNQATLKMLAKRVSEQIEADESSLYKAFADTSFLKKNGFDIKTAIAMYLPNSYDSYWTVSPEKFRDKMLSYYKKFWNKSRLAKAKKLNLIPIKVAALASIVNAESVKADERPRIAGVYLNRLRKGMKLEADPTVKYAYKQKYGEDAVIKRVLNKDKKIKSPYNTYMHTGLPPGPINMPDISSIDAVLNPEKHEYIFFCASVKRMGYHEFSKTNAQHERYARKYHDYVNKLGIRR
jgi:UPF0755 protein